MIRIPPFLEKGQKVALVSPAGCISPSNLYRIENTVKLLRRWGLEPVPGKNIMKKTGPFAGTDSERLEDFQRALDDPEIRAVLCTRGGYGSARIVDKLDFTRFNQNPKWIVGFSDITVFHSRLQNIGVASLHAFMPQAYGSPESEACNLSAETLRKALFGEELAYTFPALYPSRAGVAEAPVTGGNLSMLYSQRGTPTDINPAGKILFIEDLGEYDYHIDRMLSNLHRGGWFENLAGLMVGSFTDIKKGANPYTCDVWKMIEEYTAPYSYPVCYGVPCGHIPYNRALYMGVPAVLKVEEVGKVQQIRFLCGAGKSGIQPS